MSQRSIVVLVLLFILAGGALLLFWNRDPGVVPGSGTANASSNSVPAIEQGQLPEAAVATTAANGGNERQQAPGMFADTGVRGIVIDAQTRQPLAGVEVIAVKDEPSFEPLIQRFRGMFRDGMFVDSTPERTELGRAVSQADGTFEIRGLKPGRVFLDGRSDGWYVRTPGTARLARGEIAEGIELRASPGGRVRGVVLGADGGPVAGAHVSLRPGINAFLGQLTERKYRWLDTVTDPQGRFDLPGVPTGSGYAVSASSPAIALAEQFGVEVRAAQVSEVVLRGQAGATVAGRVLDGNGQPIAGANVAMVYLDLSRVLFSADGRTEPITTDGEGRFRIEHVAAGRVAFIAAANQLAPSNIVELAVVDGGVYDDVELRLGEGATIAGRVVDDDKKPVASAQVELRPFERPDDPQFLKMALKIRRVQATTDADGRFVAKGLTGERLVVQASKSGYTTAMRMGVRLDEKDLEIQIQRGVTIRGKVVLADASPLTRFRVDTRSQPIPKPEEAKAVADGGATAEAGGRGRRDRQQSRDGDSGATWARDDEQPGFQMRMGRGGRGGNRGNGTMQLPEGQTMMDRGMDGNWREIASETGTFELTGIPPGRVRVRVRADGYLDPESQEIDLQPGQTSAEVTFTIQPGIAVSGIVVDGATGRPVSDAQVTAYKQREQRRGNGMFQVDFDPEDMDFLALSSATGRRSVVTDSQGRFTIGALETGKFRFTARHPDMAKASAKDVEIQAGMPPQNVEIRLDAGGGIEGTLTGIGMRPLADALIVAVSIQAGAFKSCTTDRAGFYRIDGLPPGQYVVFKSRMDERADNIGLELMSNMRLKTVTVRQGKFTRLDIHDEGEDGVRVHGVVREGGSPVPRALVTLLGTDREGLFGMGVRANAAGDDGRYELIGIKPGGYVAQVTRFRGRPIQTTFEIEVPEGVNDYLFDIALPTSEVAGRVLDSRGNPVAGIQVTLGSEDGALASADGLLGLIAQNGLAQARTDDNGEFRLKSVAAGNYRLTAGSRMSGPGGRRRGADGANGGGNANRYGEGSLSGLLVDGVTPLEGLVVTVPLAGRITGIVVDGSGVAVVGANIVWAETSAPKRRQKSNPLLDLLGSQSRPITSGPDGRFEIPGLTPGTYDLRVDTEALQAGKASDIRVLEDAVADVTLTIVRGATLKLRATNVDRQKIPFAQLSLLDGQGKPVVNKMSSLTVMRRLMGSRDQVEDSGWYEFGSVPPDTYTAIITEPGKPELRITRTLRDGETVEWDVDVSAELAARDTKK